MAALHSLSTALTSAHVDVKPYPLHSWFGDFGLILVLDPRLHQWAIAVRAAARQFCFQGLVDDFRNWTPAPTTVFRTSFTPRLGGMGFRRSPRERCSLTFPGTLGLFQRPHQFFHPAPQAFVLRLQFRILALQASDLFRNRLHAFSLTALRLGATTL